ncbi:hypothetical protein DLJ96_09310, partial [Actinotalea fermentans ATCC 43279 = JCM 9966 = DSM 3133]
VPIVLGPEGWTRVLLDSLPDDETRRLRGAAAAVGSALQAAGAEGGPAAGPPGAAAVAGAAASAGPARPEGTTGHGGLDGTGDLEADEPSWVAQVEGVHRAGTLTGLTGVFSTRGVSFEHLATEEVDGDGDAGTIHVGFRASERRARALERAVGRLATVRSVVVHGGPCEKAAPPPDHGR